MRLILFIVFLFISSLSQAQVFRFKSYTTEKDGLYPYIYSIHQDQTGFLWLGTGEGLYRFDGLSFKTLNIRKEEGDNFISSGMYYSKEINWFGYNDGALAIVENNKGKTFIKNAMNGTITGIFRQGNNVICFSQNGNAMIFDKEGNLIENVSQPLQNIIILSSAPINKESFLIGSDEGLFLFSIASKTLTPIDESPVTRINCLFKSSVPNIWWAGTDDQGVLLIKNTSTSSEKETVIRVLNPAPINKYINKPVTAILQDNAKSLWVGTSGEGLFLFRDPDKELSVEHYNLSNGLPSDFIKVLFSDKENNLWIGTYGNGLARFSDDYFSFYYQGPRNLENNVTACQHSNNGILFAINNVLMLLKNAESKPIPYELPINDKISAIYETTDQTLWIGFQNAGLYYSQKGKKGLSQFIFETPIQPGNINCVTGFGEYIYAGSVNGMYIINTIDKSVIHISTAQGLPHNFINHLYADIQGNIWIATPTNFLSKYSQKQVQKISVTNNNELIKINSICQDISGKMWLATYGHGVFMIDDSVVINYNNSNGLVSNYCYSIITDESNAVWIGHRQGLTCIKGNTIRQYAKNKDIFLDFNLNAVCVDENGWLWWGTSNGMASYDFRKNRVNKSPPGIILESITVNDKDYSDVQNIDLPYGNYKIRFNFTGISMTEPELVTYNYILEGFDKEWTDHSSISSAFYPRIDDGTFVFRVKAYNSNGIASSSETSISIRISAPLWKQWWFIALCIAFLLYAFYIIIKIRERNHKKLEEYLKKTLDERTLEVIKQKEVIELKNKDITDSINYAKRIQEAILPSAHLFKRVLPDSFVFYRPRDIVSGDFYIVHQAGDLIILITADATGHGVPGAFMSLICSTIIKDILTKKSVDTPEMVLYELDAEIKQIFNSGDEDSEKPRDGLDITVCELNTKTNCVRIASAMRPFIILSQGQLTYVKGSKFSIGGIELQKKVFEQHCLQLQSGDSLYLFSDGLADQFGGPQGKKLKISGFKKLLTDASEYPISEQKVFIEKGFDDWKKNYPQIDDVLVVGIKIK
ncbi:MAG: hypothetical protein CVU05_07135 [Bacteroidetes bacterium HGW-Bacteroidetes-21]|jgi:ligand-binding sensor domain-containing protein/serine phosphatase RsbU (regulator of sigma subunit)|nr:MAG: hypothetical protein CVU05_07135 [Bacteroidetes bacterium HGW-Bacteroidetes-21]